MKKSLIILMISILSLSSCMKDVLEKVPLDIISDNTLWTDPILIESYLTQIYAEMTILTNESVGNVPQGVPDSWSLMWDGPYVVTDESDEATGNWVYWTWFKYGNLKIQGGLMEWWAYPVIRKLNEFIERVSASPLDPSVATLRIAEARFLRAFNYFAMVKRYGGVPLITELQTLETPEEELYPSRNSEKEIYDFVISELEAIANDLPDRATSEIGRPSKYAALTLKCRAALYAGSIAQFGTIQLDGLLGIPAAEANSYYQVAYDAAKEIIVSSEYALYDVEPDKATNFRNLFLQEDHSESIFVVQHNNISPGAGGNGWGWGFFQSPRPQAWGGGNNDAVYLEMVEEFEYIDGTPGKLDRTAVQEGLWSTDQLWQNKDPRFFASIYTMNTPWKGGFLDFHKGLILPDNSILNDGSYEGVLAYGDQNIDGTSFGVLKYLKENINESMERGISDQDWMVFRYAEVLLNYAEAAFELGRNNDALDAVNQIRNRAGIALLNDIDRDNIRHERKVELAFEGHRYWDVRRWRTAVVDLSKNNSGLQYILEYNSTLDGSPKYKVRVIENFDGTVAVPAFYPQNYYFPITLERTANNPKLVENPGYN